MSISAYYLSAMSRSLATDLVKPVCASITFEVEDEPLFDGPDHGHDRIESVLDLGVEGQDRSELFWCRIK